MSGGASQETKSEPWGKQKGYLADIYRQAKNAYQGTSKDPFEGDYYAKASDATNQAMAGYRGLGEQFKGLGDSTIQLGQDTIAGKYMDAKNNQYLQSHIQAALNPIQDNLMRNQLPGVRSQAIASGAYGGAGQELAEGLAIGEANKKAADVSSNISYANYDAERNRQMMAPGLLQGGAQLNQMSPQMLGQAGVMQETYDQRALDEKYRKYQDQQQAPWQGLQQYANLIYGSPQFGSQTTSQSGGVPEWAKIGIGTGLTAASIASPWMMAGQQQQQQGFRMPWPWGG